MYIWALMNRLRAGLGRYSHVYEQIVYITDQVIHGPAHIVSNKIYPIFILFRDDAALPPASSEGHIYHGPITGSAWEDAANLRIGAPLTASNLSVENLDHTL